MSAVISYKSYFALNNLLEFGGWLVEYNIYTARRTSDV